MRKTKLLNSLVEHAEQGSRAKKEHNRLGETN